MPIPKFSKTISAILARRGSAPLADVPSKGPIDNARESLSTSMIAGDTTPTSPKNTKGPTTCAKIITEFFCPIPENTPLTCLSVGSFLFAPRPLPSLSLDSPGGEYLSEPAKAVGVPVADMLEGTVAWAYKCGPAWGDKTLEDVILFYKDNRPALWGF